MIDRHPPVAEATRQGDEATARPRPSRWAVAAVAAGGLLMVITTVTAVTLARRPPSPGTGDAFKRIETGGTAPAGPAVPPTYQTVTGPPPEPPATGMREKGQRGSFYLRAAGQTSDGASVRVEEVRFEGGPGWVVVHAAAGSAPSEVIGVSGLAPTGTSTDLRITLRAPLRASAKVFVMLHREDNGNDVYDFPAADQPVRLADGTTLSVPIQVDLG